MPSALATFAKHDHGDLVPRVERGKDFWMFSNQTLGDITSFKSLGPLLGYWSYNLPITQDHLVLLNELNGGYTLLVSMRRSRWEAMERAIKALPSE